jgi:hypothetical protein
MQISLDWWYWVGDFVPNHIPRSIKGRNRQVHEMYDSEPNSRDAVCATTVTCHITVRD